MEYATFNGVCPILTCFAEGEHKHPICPACGAVGFGNIFCPTCRENIDIHRELAIIEIQNNKETEGKNVYRMD